ncbi:hypothetical protein Tco_0707834 [Tanacetum coccineum]
MITSFVIGSASMAKVAETAKSLGAIGFVLAVENASPGTKFDPVPVGIPGILITDVSKSMVHILGVFGERVGNGHGDSLVSVHLSQVLALTGNLNREKPHPF